MVSEESSGTDKHRNPSGNSQPQAIDSAGIAEIISFKKKIRQMRVYFLHGINYGEIGAQELSSFESEIRVFIGKIDDWQEQQVELAAVFNTPGELLIKLKEARRIIFRAQNLLKKKTRTEKEDNELVDKYEYLSTLCSIIFQKILVIIKEK